MSKVSAWLLVFLGMAFMLLLTLGLLERSVAPLLFGQAGTVAEADIRKVFSALTLLVGVLPYTLGVLIVAVLILGVTQAVRSKESVSSIIVLLILSGPLFYNIFLADTAAVVENLKATTPADPLPQVTESLMGAVSQHYVGLLGFGLAFIAQAVRVLFMRSASESPLR